VNGECSLFTGTRVPKPSERLFRVQRYPTKRRAYFEAALIDTCSIIKRTRAIRPGRENSRRGMPPCVLAKHLPIDYGRRISFIIRPDDDDDTFGNDDNGNIGTSRSNVKNDAITVGHFFRRFRTKRNKNRNL